LTSYTEANPKRSVYAFGINPKFPGYFFLAFKAGIFANPSSLSVKVVPNAFELNKSPYPDMKALINGFKTQQAAALTQAQQAAAAQGRR
jgi:transcription elongation factor SPT6